MRTFPEIPDWVKLEHQVQQILTDQETHGWRIDVALARELTQVIQRELEEASAILRDRHPHVGISQFTPLRDNKTKGYFTGCVSTRLTDLNPTSRDHIAWILQEKHGWKPREFTASTRDKEKQKPQIDEKVLSEIGSEDSMLFMKCLTATKMLGMLSSGVNAYLKLVTTSDRIHHHCSVGTVTGRCHHLRPNLGQTPSRSDFRKLFIPSEGMVMVGSDLAQIELRMLSHLLCRYDGGRYRDILLNGDIHQVNADAMGVTRREVKTLSYAIIYSAGNKKLGLTFDKTLSDEQANKKGKELREAFIGAIPGFGQLLTDIRNRAKGGWVKAIDGRKIHLDSPHKALNACLQASSAVIAKRWLVIAQETIKSTQLRAHQLAFIHDELQYECEPQQANDLSSALTFAAAAAGEFYKVRCPIEADARIGASWADTH